MHVFYIPICIERMNDPAAVADGIEHVDDDVKYIFYILSINSPLYGKKNRYIKWDEIRPAIMRVSIRRNEKNEVYMDSAHFFPSFY